MYCSLTGNFSHSHLLQLFLKVITKVMHTPGLKKFEFCLPFGQAIDFLSSWQTTCQRPLPIKQWQWQVTCSVGKSTMYLSTTNGKHCFQSLRNVHVHGYEPEIKNTVLVVSRCWKFANKIMSLTPGTWGIKFKMFSIRHLLLPTVCLELGLYSFLYRASTWK